MPKLRRIGLLGELVRRSEVLRELGDLFRIGPSMPIAALHVTH